MLNRNNRENNMELADGIVVSGDSESLTNIVNNFDSINFGKLRVRASLANEKLREEIEKNKHIDMRAMTELLSSSDGNGFSKVSFLPKERLLSSEEKDALKSALVKSVDSSEFTSGGDVAVFESAISSFLAIRDTVAISSGTDAMVIALSALGVSHGDEVILPANSFSATENAVLAVGATPVFCDIAVGSYNIDADKIADLVTPATKAIIPVHLYGKAACMPKIKDVANEHGLKVIEDACQSIGMTGLGVYSDCAILSFNPVKNFGICGKGGAIVTNDDALSYRCQSLSYHGFIPGEKNVKLESYGFNSKLDNILACGALSILPYLSLNNLKRTILAKRYIEKLQPLEALGKVLLPRYEIDNVWHLFPVQVLGDTSIKSLTDFFKKKNIDSEVYYPVLSHMQETSFAKNVKKTTQLATTELYHSRLIHLPLYQNFTQDEQDLVIEAMYYFFD